MITCYENARDENAHVSSQGPTSDDACVGSGAAIVRPGGRDSARDQRLFKRCVRPLRMLALSHVLELMKESTIKTVLVSTTHCLMKRGGLKQ